MSFRFTIAQVLRSSRAWARPNLTLQSKAKSQPFPQRLLLFRRNFSQTFSRFQKNATSKVKAKQPPKSGSRQAGSSPEQQYPESLVIYDAGDMRTGWVAFWKATALFQFGVVYVFILPQYYHNENEPSETKRVLITLGVGILAMIPILTLSYLTAPFVKRIHLYLPPYARRSVSTLHNYSSTLPPTARLEFVTLRAFPFERTTTVLLSELRALPPQRFRYANIARVKTEKFLRVTGWNGIWGRVFGLLNEPRWKYYVKEGKAYTFRTKVPGVWENVARAIKGQTDAIADSRLARPVKAVK